MSNLFGFVLAALLLLLAPSQASPAEVEQLLDKYSFCLVCHGYQAQGNTTVLAPALAGIEPWYFAAALDSYKAGQRHTSVTAMEMQTAARMIEPSAYPEILALISQFAGRAQQAAINAPEMAERVQRGAEVYTLYCAACHGKDAQGSEQLAAPGLRRLNSWYLVSAWQAYLTGSRGGDNAAIAAQQMRQFALSLPADLAMDDLIAYLLENPASGG